MRKSQLRASNFNEVLQIKRANEKKPGEFNIGQKILEDIGINKIRKQGGNFMDLITNA
jgi:hypothetical protein